MMSLRSFIRNPFSEMCMFKPSLMDRYPQSWGIRFSCSRWCLISSLMRRTLCLDHPPEQRRIILRTQVKDDRVRVTVRDFGPGIDKENLERIFEPFFTTKGTGLGMGLAVCHTIVEAHRGRIWAENNPDGGATFVFELPVKSNE